MAGPSVITTRSAIEGKAILIIPLALLAEREAQVDLGPHHI
jgi:hypothetical protein